MIDERWPCVEFTRTTGWEARDRPDDDLADYSSLVAWAEAHGALDGDRAERVLRAARKRPSEADAVLQRAKNLRAVLYRIFSAVGTGEDPRSRDLDDFNQALPVATRRLRLVHTGDRYRWGWSEEEAEALDRPLWAIVRSAADLLTSDELERLKLCDAEDCGWLFVDVSRNRSRRWCDMSDCGNRAKARRYRERHGSDG